MNPVSILLLPGWHGSDATHWQSHWERLHGDRRVAQHDWERPLRGDWSARLDEVVLDAPGEVVLVAHSLGCVLTAWWAAHSRHVRRVRAALLVAPADVERADVPPPLARWAPIARQRLPFAALLVASSDDPYCTPERSRGLVRDWGAQLIEAGALGHVNAQSGLGAWPEGRALLEQLMARAGRHSREETDGNEDF